MPACLAALVSVRTRRMHQSAAWAKLVQTFCPFTMK
jgi:hypothetical protein